MTSIKEIARKAFRAGAITEDEYHQVLVLDRAYMEMLAEKGTIINIDNKPRDCEHCKHYVEKDGSQGCEVWDCEFEGKSDG